MNGSASDLIIDSSGTNLYALSSDHSLLAIDLRTLKLTREIVSGGEFLFPNCGVIDPVSGMMFVTMSWGGYVRRVNLQTGQHSEIRFDTRFGATIIAAGICITCSGVLLITDTSVHCVYALRPKERLLFPTPKAFINHCIINEILVWMPKELMDLVSQFCVESEDRWVRVTATQPQGQSVTASGRDRDGSIPAPAPAPAPATVYLYGIVAVETESVRCAYVACGKHGIRRFDLPESFPFEDGAI